MSTIRTVNCVTGEIADRLATNEELSQMVREPTAEDIRRQLQATRDTALQSIVHDFLDGRIVQVRHQDLGNFNLAIANNVAREWVMADNSVALLTVAEMKTARGSGIAQGEVVWDNYIAELKLL